jgi:hypothetical protein
MANTNIMFKVGDTDYSNKVIGKDYQVQNLPQFIAWTDANGREHRSVYRHQVSGTFTMLFETIDLYKAFCADLASKVQNDTSYPCTVFDNNTDTEITSRFFITYTPSRHINDMWQDAIGTIKVTIKER